MIVFAFVCTRMRFNEYAPDRGDAKCDDDWDEIPISVQVPSHVKPDTAYEHGERYGIERSKEELKQAVARGKEERSDFPTERENGKCRKERLDHSRHADQREDEENCSSGHDGSGAFVPNIHTEDATTERRERVEWEMRCFFTSFCGIIAL